MVRPTQEIKRDLRVTIRLTQDEYDIVIGEAGKAGLKLSDYVRKRAVCQQVYARISREELEVLQILIEYRTNFHRIGNLIRARDWTGTVQMTDYLAREIEKIIGLFKEKGGTL